MWVVPCASMQAAEAHALRFLAVPCCSMRPPCRPMRFHASACTHRCRPIRPHACPCAPHAGPCDPPCPPCCAMRPHAAYPEDTAEDQRLEQHHGGGLRRKLWRRRARLRFQHEIAPGRLVHLWGGSEAGKQVSRQTSRLSGSQAVNQAAVQGSEQPHGCPASAAPATCVRTRVRAHAGKPLLRAARSLAHLGVHREHKQAADRPVAGRKHFAPAAVAPEVARQPRAPEQRRGGGDARHRVEREFDRLWDGPWGGSRPERAGDAVSFIACSLRLAEGVRWKWGEGGLQSTGGWGAGSGGTVMLLDLTLQPCS